jgi:alkanesulfonate monooxygenase SsuD/methylene tetrahydromethanopterin reductase-like flavin-dependent oxidoreductase (luciferase family)
VSRAPWILSAQVAAGVPMSDPALALPLVQAAEAAGVDLLVLGESVAGSAAPAFDPLIVAAWLAPHARGVGLIATVSALHSEPFHVARAMSALDFITGGRSGWLPTTAGIDWPRYGGVGEVSAEHQVAKALDFVAATESLWDSWDSDALIIDQASGAYLHADRVRRSNYNGPYHQVQGPLNAARPPQGYPLLLQSDRDLTNAVGRSDVKIVGADAPPDPGATRLIVRIGVRDCHGSTLAALARRWESGAIAGLHLLLTDPLADLGYCQTAILPELDRLGIAYGQGREQPLRTRLGLPVPRSAAESARRGVL